MHATSGVWEGEYTLHTMCLLSGRVCYVAKARLFCLFAPFHLNDACCCCCYVNRCHTGRIRWDFPVVYNYVIPKCGPRSFWWPDRDLLKANFLQLSNENCKRPHIVGINGQKLNIPINFCHWAFGTNKSLCPQTILITKKVSKSRGRLSPLFTVYWRVSICIRLLFSQFRVQGLPLNLMSSICEAINTHVCFASRSFRASNGFGLGAKHKKSKGCS